MHELVLLPSMYLGARLRCGDIFAPSSHPAYKALWPVQLYHYFSHIVSQTVGFAGGKNVIEHKICVLNFTTSFV